MMSHSLVNEQPPAPPIFDANLQLPAGTGQSSTFSENWNVKLGDILRPLLSGVWRS
jgi:hypothetical protein